MLYLLRQKISLGAILQNSSFTFTFGIKLLKSYTDKWNKLNRSDRLTFPNKAQPKDLESLSVSPTVEMTDCRRMQAYNFILWPAMTWKVEKDSR